MESLLESTTGLTREFYKVNMRQKQNFEIKIKMKIEVGIKSTSESRDHFQGDEILLEMIQKERQIQQLMFPNENFGTIRSCRLIVRIYEVH